MSQGKLVIFSAPSGSGKTTIVKKLLEQDFGFEFSVSATSRPPRGKEKNGTDYYFLSPNEFRQKIEENAFLEWEEVYPDRFYGTLKSEVERITQKGKNVIFDVDVVGGLNIKKHYGNRALSVFISPPSIDALRTRLTSRGTDDAKAIETRLAKAEWEMNFSEQFDIVIVNDNLSTAIADTEKVVRTFLND